MLDTMKSARGGSRKRLSMPHRHFTLGGLTNSRKQMKKTIGRHLARLIAVALFYCPAASNAGGPPDLNGTWIGYYNDGTKSEYVWRIRQTDLTLSIENVGGKNATSKGRIEGDKVIAQDFATQNGTLSDDGMKITWTDGVVWKKLPAPDLNGTWIDRKSTRLNSSHR